MLICARFSEYKHKSEFFHSRLLWDLLRKTMHVHDHNSGFFLKKCHKGDTDIMRRQFVGIIVGRNYSAKASWNFVVFFKVEEWAQSTYYYYFPICLSPLLHKFLDGKRHCFVHISVFIFLSPRTIPGMCSLNVYWMNNLINNSFGHREHSRQRPLRVAD